MFNHYKPAQLYKIMLEELPEYKKLKKCSVFDYVPEWKREKKRVQSVARQEIAHRPLQGTHRLLRPHHSRRLHRGSSLICSRRFLQSKKPQPAEAPAEMTA